MSSAYCSLKRCICRRLSSFFFLFFLQTEHSWIFISTSAKKKSYHKVNGRAIGQRCWIAFSVNNWIFAEKTLQFSNCSASTHVGADEVNKNRWDIIHLKYWINFNKISQWRNISPHRTVCFFFLLLLLFWVHHALISATSIIFVQILEERCPFSFRVYLQVIIYIVCIYVYNIYYRKFKVTKRSARIALHNALN